MNHKRRSSLKNDPFPVVEWKLLLERFNGWCPYCGESGFVLTIDHVVPISKGGTNSISNLIPCCIRCNLSKNNKDFDKWIRYLESK